MNRNQQLNFVIQNISQTDGNNDLYNIFGCKIFDNPKPVDLIKWLIEIASKKDSIILDFFLVLLQDKQHQK